MVTDNGKVYDSIVIGAGIAGLTAAVFVARAGLKVLIIGDIKGSMVVDSECIGNYIGLNKISGIQILERGIKQVKEYGAEHIINEVVHAVQEEETKTFLVKTADAQEFRTKTLVIATGTSYKQSGADNEDDYKGKGIHYCVACDGWFYKGKKVIVVGNSNLAAEEAIELTAFTTDVTMVSQSEKFDITPQLMGGLKKNGIKMIEAQVTEFTGKDKVDGAKLDNGTMIQADGVFVAMGTARGIDFSNKLGLIMDKGYIIVDKDCKTNLEGVYAAGSCIDGNVQLAKSAGDGCNAGIGIIRTLKGLEEYVDQT